MSTTNSTPIKQIMAKASFGSLHGKLFFLKSCVSKRNTIAVERKKIVILIQSRVFPNAPL